MTKRALLVGCNYPGTNAELNGCIGDVWGWKSILEECYGFDPDNIKVLIDTDDDYPKPTGKNIKDALREAVGESGDGDILVFHFSGHGVQVPDDDEGEEADGMDEAICPCDFNMIIDDDMREILGPLDPGCKFTMISDCCHSGGMLDHEEVVISGDADDDTEAYGDPQQAREINLADVGDFDAKNRAIDANMLTNLLTQTVAQQGLDLVEKKARNMLASLFGMDSSNAASAYKSTPSASYSRAGQKPEDGKIDPNKGILITGCQSTETSADVTGNEGNCFGALSHTFQNVVRRHHQNHPGEPITYRQATLKVRKLLNSSGFSQNPCLECSDANADSNFIEF
eukprot:evm.model.scf_4042.2 EVM.evm.TU.scf_4042.2   scf_4042:4871-9058(-)